MPGKQVVVGKDEMPLMEAAAMLGESYAVSRDLMLRGRLRGRKVGFYWVVDRESVERLKVQRAAPAVAAA